MTSKLAINKNPVSFNPRTNKPKNHEYLFTRANVVEILVQELLKRQNILAQRFFFFRDKPVLFILVGVEFPGKKHAKVGWKKRHTSLAALAMSEKAAGADILDYRKPKGKDGIGGE